MNKPMACTLPGHEIRRSLEGSDAFSCIPVRRSALAFLLLSATIPILSAGCALSRAKVSANAVSARQLSLRGIDARQRGRLQEAESLLGQASEMCPLDEKIRSHYAETLWDSNQRDQAVANMEEAVRLSGGDIDRVVRLGEMYLAQGDLERAAVQADRAIQANRPLAAGWALRGNVLRALNRDRESLASYHRALSYQEHYPSVQLAIAEIYRRQGRHGRELATLRTLSDGYPPGETPPEVLYQEGLALKELRRYQAAANLLASAAEQGEPNSELLYHLAESQWLAGDPANARLTLRSALERSNASPPDQRVVTELLSLQRRLSDTSRL